MCTVSKPTNVSQSQFDAVMNWDMSRVNKRLMLDHSLAETYVKQLEQEYKKYLLMVIAHPGQGFPMSAPVDLYAHQHFIDSRDLQALLRQVNPALTLNHQPTVDEAEKEALLPLYHQSTIPTLRQMFGVEQDSSFWPANRCVCRWDCDVRAAA